MSNQMPHINIKKLEKQKATGVSEHRALIIGSVSDVGSVNNKELLSNVKMEDAASFLGGDSLAYYAVKRFKKYNPYTELDVLCLKPTGGAAPVAVINVLGAATNKNEETINIRIADDEFSVVIKITPGDTPTVVQEKIKKAIEDESARYVAEGKKEIFPFIVTTDGVNNTKITSKTKGDMLNKSSIFVEGNHPGLLFTIIPFTDGDGSFDGESELENLTERYQTVLFDSAIAYASVEKWLVERDETPNAIMGGQGYTFLNNPLSEFEAMLDNVPPEFLGKEISVFANCDEAKINAIPLLIVSEFGAKEALRLTPGADITKIVVDPERSPGGIQTASLPIHNTPMNYYKFISKLKHPDVSKLYGLGFSLFVNTSENKVVTGQVRTLWRGEEPFRSLEGVRSASLSQEYIFNNLRKKIAQAMIVDGPISANSPMHNERTIRSMIQVFYDDLVGIGLLSPAANANDTFTQSLIVEIDPTKGEVKANADIILISQVKSFSMNLYYSYSGSTENTEE